MKVYVVHAHPMANSFTRACAKRAIEALQSAGHEVRYSDLHDDGFEPELTLAERRGQFDDPATKAVLAPYAPQLLWADALVLVYPTWWSAQPALLKGWFDRVWVSGVAYNPPNGKNHITARLKNIKRLAVITTHGSSKWVNVVQGEPGKRVVFRAMRLMCHPFVRTSWTALYSIDRATEAQRTDFLQRVERRMRRL